MTKKHVHRWGKWYRVAGRATGAAYFVRECRDVKTCGGEERLHELDVVRLLNAPRPKFVRVGTVLDLAKRQPGEPPNFDDVLYMKRRNP